MRLVVVSHKICWSSPESPGGYATDGGFPLQIKAISELFDETELLVPCTSTDSLEGTSPLDGKRLSITSLTVPKGTGLRRKFDMLIWTATNGLRIWRAVKNADAVHTPIPGDVGTIGMMTALLLRKRLFVRHCGNWMMPRTISERLWRWLMERFAGGRNVMMATGGSDTPPSNRNPNVKWIFSTSLKSDQMKNDVRREPPCDRKLRLVIACRQEERKGTDIVIDALALLAKKFENATLDVIGDGSKLESLQRQADRLNVKDRVVFHGKIRPADVLNVMSKGHLFCYPTSASEGFPKVVLEALATGLPVITTKVSVLPSLLESGCGVLLEAASAEELAKSIEKVCGDRDIYSQMSKCAITTARRYSLENWRDAIGQALSDAWKVDSLGHKRQVPELIRS